MILYPWMMPIPSWNTKPITLYSYMDSIVNYGKAENEKKKTRELAKYSRTTIFDFEYPLSTNVNKEKFETQILNHFILRRIGYETPTAFEIALENKLNEIMPNYNKMFDMLEEWDVFNDGEKETREQETTMENESSSETSGTDKRKYSKYPQNELENLEDDKYVTDYTISNSDGESTNNSNGNGTLSETIERTPSNKIDLYVKYQNEMAHIMSLIYKELEILFYALI